MAFNSKLDGVFILFFSERTNFSASGLFNGSNHRIIQQKIDQTYIQNNIVIVPGFADIIPDNDLGK